jgi:hypothetical protein
MVRAGIGGGRVGVLGTFPAVFKLSVPMGRGFSIGCGMHRPFVDRSW